MAYTSFRDQMRDEVLLRFRRTFAGLDRAFRELARPGRAVPGSRTLARTDWVRFFGALRPRVAPEVAGMTRE